MKFFGTIAIFIIVISASQGVSVEDCITNSKNENFEFKLWVHRYDLITCLEKEGVMGNVQNVVRLISQKDEEAIHKFAEADCPRIRDSLRCPRGYLEEMRQCFNEEEQELELIKSFPTRMNSLFDIFCDNEGENLIEISRNNGSNLFAREADVLLQHCLTSWIEKSKAYETYDPTFKANSDTMQAATDMRQCFLDAAVTLKTSKDFLVKLFDTADADLLISLVSIFTYEPGFKTIQKMSDEFETPKSEKYLRRLGAIIIGLNEGDETKREMVEVLKNSL